MPVVVVANPKGGVSCTAGRGLTLFDVVPGRVEKDLAQWQAICEWLDA